MRNEDIYRILFEKNSNGIMIHKVIMDEQGRVVNSEVLMINAAYEKYIGLQAAEIIGKKITDIFPAISNIAFMEIIDQAIASGGTASSDIHMETMGGMVHIETFRLDEDTFVTYIAEMPYDGQPILKLDRPFSRLVENVHDAIYRYEMGAESRFTYVSPASLSLLGYTPEEHYADPSLILGAAHPDDRHIIRALLDGKAEKGKPVASRWIKKDGTVIWIEQHNVYFFDDMGNVIAIEGIARDITDRKLVELELQESKERLSLAMEAGGYGLWELSLDEGNVYIDDYIYKIVGFNPIDYQLDLKLLFSLVHPDDKNIVQEVITASDSKADPFSLDFRVRHRSGTWVWVSCKGKRRDIDQDGRSHRLIGTLVDITSRVKAEQVLLYARALADDSNRIKTELLNNVNHELRTPLSVIIGFSELLLDGDDQIIGEEQRKHLDYVCKSGYQLLDVVERILFFANTEHIDLSTLEPELTDVGLLFNEIKSSLLTKTIKKNIDLTFIYKTGLTQVVVDRKKLKDVLYNLIDNAIKFTDDGSVKVTVEHTKGVLLFSVKDTGIGITAEKMEHLFEPFVQIDGSTTRKYSGAGLGLALVKKLIDVQGGTIRVESEPGKGSNFIFEIPLMTSA